MSYRICYLVPKKEFERLMGKKQPGGVPIKSKEVPTARTPAPRGRAKPKITAEKLKRTKKAKEKRGKERPKKAKQPIAKKKKKCRIHDERDPWAWEKNQTTAEIQKWGESEPPMKKSKNKNAEKYFDDVPRKKTKVSRLMKFMDRNKDVVRVGDDFEILIRNKVIPGSDFIEIMNFLQKGREAVEGSFIPSRDPQTGMPVATRRFIDALHEAIEGELIPGDMDEEDVKKFATKLSEFAGLKMEGVKRIVGDMAEERGRNVDKIRVGNKDYLAKLEADEEKQEEEQAKARQVFEDMEAEDREVRERQAREVAERARNKRRKQKRFKYTMLKRIRDDATEEPLTSSDDEEDVAESRKDAKHRRRKQLVKSMKTVGKIIDEKMKGETELDKKTMKRVPKRSLATKTYEEYLQAKKDSPEGYRRTFSLDHLERLHEMAMRRAGMIDSPTVKELIKLEEKKLGEKSDRMPTVKEVLRDKPLEETDEDVRTILPFAAEGGESEGEVGEEEEEAGEREVEEEKETS